MARVGNPLEIGGGAEKAAMCSYGQKFCQQPANALVFDFKTGRYTWQDQPQGPAPVPTQAATLEQAHPVQSQRGFFAGRESLRSRARGRVVQSHAPAEKVATPQRAPAEVAPFQQSKKLELAKVVEVAEAIIEIGQDSDGEETFMCPLCHLPMGNRISRGKEGKGAPMHGECMAQFALLKMKAEEEARLREDAALKAASRREHGIGWSVALVPCGQNLASRLDGFVHCGMACVVLEEDNSVRLAPTCDPVAAVNLEYLLLALQVRRSTGREARFSLDPSPATGMQVKRFEPAWLADTSAGDVLFQADYYLKELSMGESEQPVVGMTSCFDIAVAEGLDKRWQGREWYVVRKADIQLSEDNVLVPSVKMGVEAREQQIKGDGLRDAAITRPDHPLVRYAEAFTRNFDLIAERKGSVHHLREFAKASCVARFLLEAGVTLNDSWFTLADEGARVSSSKEIPCLWSQRGYKTIRIKDGALVDPEDLEGPARMGVYGGAEIDLGAQAPAQWARAAEVMMTGQIPAAGAAVAGAPGQIAAAVPGAGVARAVRSRRQALKMRASRRGPRVLEGPGLPQGVDLNLDAFELDAGYLAGRCLQAPEGCPPLGKAFWSEIASAGSTTSAFKAEDKKLLQRVFHPHLTDRQDEGDLFAPPDNSLSYVEKLRGLVRAEDAVRQQRREHFLSVGFSAASPGPLFPASWASRFSLAHENGKAEPQGALQPRPDHKPSRESLRSAKLEFDGRTEDGTRFRIYRPGSIEVRTIQESEGEEVIGMVFSIAAPARASRLDGVEDGENIAKVTAYIEGATGASTAGRCYYVVLKTQKGNLVVTEKLRDGSVSWEENPHDLEVRNSLAKVICSEHLSGLGASVKDLRGLKAAEPAAGKSGAASASQRKFYAMKAYCRAGGKPIEPLEGLQVIRQGKTAKIA
uniref:Uncharacterized protein n=1 Tax=Alexandrium monilatum TaxID=311494 RepID=A0A7S4UXJ1_9DINO